MCGATGQQEQIASSQQGFMSQLQGAFGQNFGEQSDILKNLTSSLTPIAEAGPGQQGYTPTESAALNTEAIDSVGENYAHAAQAEGNRAAAAGGGNEFTPSGAQTAEQGRIATAASQQLSGEQQANTVNNYNTGRSNYYSAIQGLGGVASGLNPEGLAGGANTAGGEAATDANNVAQANAAPLQMAAGLIGGLGSAALGGDLFSGGGGGGSQSGGPGNNGGGAGGYS